MDVKPASVPPAAAAHSNWRTVLVDYGSLAALLVFVGGGLWYLSQGISDLRVRVGRHYEQTISINRRLDRLEQQTGALAEQVAVLRVGQARLEAQLDGVDGKLDRVLEALAKRKP